MLSREVRYYIDSVEVSEAQARGYAERHGMHVHHMMGECCDHWEDSLDAERLVEKVETRKREDQGFWGRG